MKLAGNMIIKSKLKLKKLPGPTLSSKDLFITNFGRGQK